MADFDFDHPKMKVDEKGDLWLNFGDYGQEILVSGGALLHRVRRGIDRAR